MFSNSLSFEMLKTFTGKIVSVCNDSIEKMEEISKSKEDPKVA